MSNQTNHNMVVFVMLYIFAYSFERGMVVEGLTILLKLLWAQSLHFNHAHLKTQTLHKIFDVSFTSLMGFFYILVYQS